MSHERPRGLDPSLRDRCLQKDPEAWRWLLDQYQADLRAWIQWRVRRNPSLRSAVDDLVELVWVALLDQDSRRLRAYDPRRSFPTFLKVLARQVICQWLREENRQCRTVSLYRRPVLDPDAVEQSVAIACDDVAPSLTRKEHWFLDGFLLHEPEGPHSLPLSDANRRKLRERVLRKLRHWVRGE
jgi:DNA-directed RNA polymerase specialized sigma24 family protein